MQFKTPRIGIEYDLLKTNNPRLHAILAIADEYSRLEFGKGIVVTELLRTPTETAELYKEYAAPPAWRPHENWLAADLRSSIYTDAEIQKFVTFLNMFTSFGGQRKTAVYHAIKGNTFHFHLQTHKPEAT